MVGHSIQVWQVDLSDAKGREQKQKRPALLWRDLDHVGLAIVIPITSNLEREKIAHTHRISADAKNGLNEESIALIFQIRAIDKNRLVKKLGELGEDDTKAVVGLLKDLLRL